MSRSAAPKLTTVQCTTCGKLHAQTVFKGVFQTPHFGVGFTTRIIEVQACNRQSAFRLLEQVKLNKYEDLVSVKD